jgi:hypothetical protein
VVEHDLADAAGESRSEEPVSHAGDCFQAGPGDLRGEGLTVRQRAERVFERAAHE